MENLPNTNNDKQVVQNEISATENNNNNSETNELIQTQDMNDKENSQFENSEKEEEKLESNQDSDDLLPHQKDESIGVQDEDDLNNTTELMGLQFDPNTIPETDPKYAEYLQMLLQEIEDLENEIKRKSDREYLLDHQKNITEKLENIGKETEEEEEFEIKKDLTDQISMLKYEQTVWENKIK